MKTILITGVGRGIGYALTKEFLNNNWKVIGAVRDINRSLTFDDHKNFQKQQLDVSSFDSISDLVEILEGVPIDILLNNAGVMDASGLSEHIYDNEEKLTEVFLVNAIAPYILAENLIPNLRLGNEKYVVSISSLLSNIKDMMSSHWVYGSSKSALNYAMNAFMKNYPEFKVSLVRPGWVQTDMGGNNALITPEHSAKIIFKNITNHKEKLPSGAMVGPEGDITYFT